jgi:hypothetical protein
MMARESKQQATQREKRQRAEAVKVKCRANESDSTVRNVIQMRITLPNLTELYLTAILRLSVRRQGDWRLEIEIETETHPKESVALWLRQLESVGGHHRQSLSSSSRIMRMAKSGGCGKSIVILIPTPKLRPTR